MASKAPLHPALPSLDSLPYSYSAHVDLVQSFLVLHVNGVAASYHEHLPAHVYANVVVGADAAYAHRLQLVYLSVVPDPGVVEDAWALLVFRYWSLN